MPRYIFHRSSVQRIQKAMNEGTGRILEKGGYADVRETGNLHFYSYFRRRHLDKGKNVIVIRTPPSKSAFRIMWHTHPGTCYKQSRKMSCSLPCFSAKDIGSFFQDAINNSVHAHVLFSNQEGIFVLYLLPEPRRHIATVTDDMARDITSSFRELEDSFAYPREYQSYLRAIMDMIDQAVHMTDKGEVRLFRLDHFPKGCTSAYVDA